MILGQIEGAVFGIAAGRPCARRRNSAGRLVTSSGALEIRRRRTTPRSAVRFQVALSPRRARNRARGLGIFAGCCIPWKVKHLSEPPGGPWQQPGALAGLILIATGSVVAGVIADSPVFWGAAGAAFLTSARTLVAYLRRRLGLPCSRSRRHPRRRR
jgi:hypothetical protein